MQLPVHARLIRRLLLPLLAAFVGIGANAAVFVKRWDPEFNTAFSGLVGTDVGWSGEAFVSIADDCLTGGSIWVGTGACGDSDAELERGTLRFYNVTNDETLLSLTWDKADIGSADILKVVSDGTNLVGIVTSPITFDPQSLEDRDVDIFLSFLVAGEYSGPFLTLTTEIPVCVWTWHGKKCFEITKPFFSSIDPGLSTTPSGPDWTRVPEPGTLALIGLALAAGGWVRRRVEVSKKLD